MAKLKRLVGAISARIKARQESKKAAKKELQLGKDPYQDPDNWGRC